MLPMTGTTFIVISVVVSISLVMHTLFAAVIPVVLRRWMAVVRFFLPGRSATEPSPARTGLVVQFGPVW